MNGRFYLKLEFAALKKALTTNNGKKQLMHIKNAIYFRLYRQQLFHQAKENENLLEINEGLAEYTGSTLSGRNDKELKGNYLKLIDQLFAKGATFVRSFAYRTIPVYGCFMKLKDENWNKKINDKTNLTDYIKNFYHISNPDNLRNIVTQIQNEYNYNEIKKEETEWARLKRKLMAKLDEKFQNNPTLTIPLINMHFGFNPSELIPYKGIGTVYPNLRVTDVWGILTVKKGALLDKNWKKVVVSEPTKISDLIVEGNGWRLKLKNKWKVEKIKNNYILKNSDNKVR